MALPSTIYRAGLQLADLDRHCYESLQITLAQHPSETPERLLARLLAYALCYREGLAFTRGVGAGDEPDLWAHEPDGRVALWVEVGLPDPARLQKAARHAGEVVLLAFGPTRFRWEGMHLATLARISNLRVLGLDYAFLGALSAGLQRTIDWAITITEGVLYLQRGGETLETKLQVLT